MDLLLELEQRARKDGIPAVSHATGRLLSTLVHAMQAHRILELGTGYGYSTLCMALAQPPVGKIWTVDFDIARTIVARSYFERADEAESIEILNQPALEVVENFPTHNLDIVFIDADRAEYSAYLEACLPLLKLSGLLIAHGLIGEPRLGNFNEAFVHHPQLDAIILQHGDGTGLGARIR